MIQKLPAWTASSLAMFTNCPYRYYRQRVAKDVKDQLSEVAAWGIKVHKAFEDHVNYGVALPEGLDQWAPLATKIKAMTGEKLPEYRFSVGEDHKPCLWKDAWSRGQADLVVRNGSTVVILDYKTGKRKPSDQLALYAGYAFDYWPEVTKVMTAFVWLKEKKIDRSSYERKDIPTIWGLWLPTVARLRIAHEKNEWPKRPCGLCRGYCPVADCVHCEARR